MKTMLKLLSVAAFFAASTSLAMADPLTLLGSAATFGTFTGQQITTKSVTPLVNAGDKHPFTAKYSEKVYMGGTSAFCSTCLNFVFNIQDVGSATDFIDVVSITSFLGVTTSEGYLAGGDLPTSVSNISGIITYTYTNPVLSKNTSSVELVIFTNATTTAVGVINFQDGSQVQSNAIVGSPLLVHHLTPSPEPSSLMLLGTGLLTAVGAARRKLKA